jgi:ribosome biogenesis GTPase
LNTNTNTDVMLQGVITKKLRGQYLVNFRGEEMMCSVSGKLYKELIFPLADPSSLRHVVVDVEEINAVDPIAIGDRVSFYDVGDGTGRITEVLPRQNEMRREATNGRKMEQVIAANVDQVIPVIAAAQPKPMWGMLDRFLVAAEADEIPAVVIITKMDLVRGKKAEARIREEADIYRSIGYEVLLTSAEDGEGIDAVRDLLRERLSVFVGRSGVGKTSLLNAVESDLGLRVKDVNVQRNEGRHTTTHVEMFQLQSGGYIVDTPGMRQFKHWEIDDVDLALFFPEMAAYIGQCKFGASCSHTHEPDCAIKEAVAAGQIAERRYQSFVAIQNVD